jgi:hypothetical protein
LRESAKKQTAKCGFGHTNTWRERKGEKRESSEGETVRREGGRDGREMDRSRIKLTRDSNGA